MNCTKVEIESFETTRERAFLYP